MSTSELVSSAVVKNGITLARYYTSKSEAELVAGTSFSVLETTPNRIWRVDFIPFHNW